MSMSEPEISVNVLVDAKKEYTKKLVNVLALPIYQGIQSIYEQAKQASDEANHQNYLRTFQILLREVPRWNQDIIDTEHNRIVLETKCNWLNNLIRAVFISHVKVLSAVRMGGGYKKIKLNVPSSSKFVHTCYVEAARAFYKNPYLLSHDVADIKVHKNMVEALGLIKDAIKDAIERLIPFQQIIYEYVDHPDNISSDDNNSDNDEIPSDEDNDEILSDEDINDKTNNETNNNDTNNESIDELEDFDKPDLVKEQEVRDTAGTQASVDIPDEQRHQVKNIMIAKETGARAVPEQQVIHRKIQPEHVGNVDLSGYDKKLEEDKAVFFSDAEDDDE